MRCKEHDFLEIFAWERAPNSFFLAGALPPHPRQGAAAPGPLPPPNENPVRGLSEHSLLLADAVRRGLHPLQIRGARGGVENGVFCMLSWTLPAPGGEKRKLHGHPRLPWSASPPCAAVSRGKSGFGAQPLGFRSRRGRSRGSF